MNQLWRSNRAASIDGRRVVVVWPESTEKWYTGRLKMPWQPNPQLPQIDWGRLVVDFVFMLIAFWIGRSTR